VSEGETCRCVNSNCGTVAITWKTSYHFGFFLTTEPIKLQQTLIGETVLITGASSGIGEACAEVMAASGARLILSARRVSRLESISKDLETRFGAKVYICPFDVRSYDEVKLALETLPSEWKKIDILINNAGVGKGWSKMYDGDIDDWDETIDCNVKGVMYVTRIVLPEMVRSGKGHVVNIASISGIETYPNDAVYCASKAAVRALTDALKKDLLGTPIRVTAISPGMVRTEFANVRHHGRADAGSQSYQGYTPLEPVDVAEVVLFAATRPSHVNINEIVMMPVDQASPTLMNLRDTSSRS
jgi:3-hydroxy acid dehydrogenase / malonic semialdehyde reductase